jgi:hypothetical protein
MSRRTPTFVVAALVASAAALSGLPASAGEPPPSTKHYPSDCGTATLQLCVGGAVPGDTILIDTDDPIEEYVMITKSLTLGAAPGTRPTIVGGIGITASLSTIAVTVRDLTVEGPVGAEFTGGSAHAVAIDHVTATADTNSIPISLYTSVSAGFTVRSSRALNANDTLAGISVFDQHDSGVVSAFLVGNRVSSGSPTSGAGIDIRVQGAGTTRASVYNNVIWRAARWDGTREAGIFVRAEGVGDSEVNVVGNTVDRVDDDGLRLEDQLDAPGTISLDMFDNLFAHTAGAGVDLRSDDPGTRTIRAGSNAFFDNAEPNDFDGANGGTVLQVTKPGFVDEQGGDLSLTATSPLVDAGKVCTPGGLENLDAAGAGRLAGPSVDVGAYERGATAPTGEAAFGTSGGEELIGGPGADILCGLGGGDALFGGGGRDYIDGGAGPDEVLNGQAGPDRVFGGKGADVCLDGIDGIGGNDRLDGGKGTDGARGDEFDVLIRTEGPPVDCTD